MEAGEWGGVGWVGRRAEVVTEVSGCMTAKQNSEDLYTSAQP